MFVVTMMLCDSVQIVDDKLMIVGGGWSRITGPYAGHALAILIDSPLQYENQVLTLTLALTSDDGPVSLITESGVAPLQIEHEFTPHSFEHGALAMVTPVAVNIADLQLSPGEVFHWTASISAGPRMYWSRSFYVQDVERS